MKRDNKSMEFNDIRFMSLYRWNLPQTNHVFGKNYDGELKRGDYVSYCTHHFVDILPAATKCKHTLLKAYEQLLERRKKIQQPDMDIHTVQSMTLVGPTTDFWDTPADVLYMTFIQLVELDIGQFGVLEKKIKKTISSLKSPVAGKAPEFSLYYSYDFCDLVLFTKNIKFNDLHDALWEITLIRPDAFANIRDTFTICSFGWDFLKDCFKQFSTNSDTQSKVHWDDELSVSVNLSTPSLSNWNALKAELTKYMALKEYRLPGRNDINFSAERISGTTVLRILYELDNLCHSDQSQTLGGYEVILQAAPWEGNPSSDSDEFKKKIIRRGELNEAAKQLLDELCKGNPSNGTDYLFETKRSLEELLKNGFADEFVISVLPSFIAYLKIGLECINHKKSEKSLDDLRRRYYTALNTLSLCTMHDERQFIQAPSFNASYFDIPPKLLAFFNAIAFEMSAKLHEAGLSSPETESNPYRFVIAPDYRKDIYVKAPQINTPDDTEEHLAIIKLCEKYFFDPKKTIMLLAHEIGHFVGDRKRETRARLIFKSISLYLLSNVPVSSILTKSMPSISDLDMLGLFADTLADYLVEDARRKIKPTRKINFLLEDISDYIEAINYGTELFFKDSTREAIEEKWRKALMQKLKADDSRDYCYEQLRRGLTLLQEKGNSDYLTREIETGLVPESVVEVYTRYIATCVSNLQFEALHNNDMISALVQNGENVVSAFSESYADLRLYQLCGQMFCFEEYEQLLSEINGSPYGHEVRCKALLQVSGHASGSMVDKDESLNVTSRKKEYAMSEKLKHTIIEYVVSYLNQCICDECKSVLAEESLEAFRGDNLYEQCCVIDKTISDYRKKLISFCQENLNKSKDLSKNQS